jgi:hypothetical protein
MNARLLTHLCCALLLTSISCDEGSNPVYDHLLFIRQGAGGKVFTISPADSPDAVTIIVTQYWYRDTLVQFRSRRDVISSSSFSAFFQALNGEVQITGDFRQSTLPTGTWAFFYMIRNGEQLEITNTELRNQLLPFETIVNHHFPSTP